MVTGAGPVGWTVAEQLAEQGLEVLVLTRSGSGPARDNVQRRSVDVSDAADVRSATAGATAYSHCIHGTAVSAPICCASGPRPRASHMGERIVEPVLAGKKVRVLGSLDQPHSWTHVPDLARAMITASQREDLWNRVLHAPTAPPRTQREMVHAFATAAGVEIPEPGAVPTWALRVSGVFSTPMREIAELAYQFTDPFVMDSSASQELLGFAPTPTDDVAAQTVAWWRAQA